MTLPNDSAPMPNLPPGNTSSNTWDPVTISNIIFSAVMALIGIIAIWQAHRAHRRMHRTPDEEEIIGGIRLPSRASTTLSDASNNPISTSAPDTQASHQDSTSAITATSEDNIPADSQSCL